MAIMLFLRMPSSVINVLIAMSHFTQVITALECNTVLMVRFVWLVKIYFSLFILDNSNSNLIKLRKKPLVMELQKIQSENVLTPMIVSSKLKDMMAMWQSQIAAKIVCAIQETEFSMEKFCFII